MVEENDPNQTAVLIFAKYPIKHYVKTRLETSILTPDDTLLLYKAFLKDTIMQAQITPKVDTIILSLANPVDFNTNLLHNLDFFEVNNEMIGDKVYPSFHQQPEGSFGERMADAIRYCRSLEVGQLIILGADAPQIQPNLLNKVVDRLHNTDIILGPSPAGGIYLIGMSNHFELTRFDTIFKEVELISFSQEVASQDFELEIIEELTDIDTEEDLIGLISWIKSVEIASGSNRDDHVLPKHTQSVIEKLDLRIEIDPVDNRKKRIVKSNTNI